MQIFLRELLARLSVDVSAKARAFIIAIKAADRIGRLQRHAMDAFFSKRLPALVEKDSRAARGRVACIGAGPASLALLPRNCASVVLP